MPNKINISKTVSPLINHIYRIGYKEIIKFTAHNNFVAFHTKA